MAWPDNFTRELDGIGEKAGHTSLLKNRRHLEQEKDEESPSEIFSQHRNLHNE